MTLATRPPGPSDLTGSYFILNSLYAIYFVLFYFILHYTYSKLLFPLRFAIRFYICLELAAFLPSLPGTRRYADLRIKLAPVILESPPRLPGVT